MTTRLPRALTLAQRAMTWIGTPIGPTQLAAHDDTRQAHPSYARGGIVARADWRALGVAGPMSLGLLPPTHVLPDDRPLAGVLPAMADLSFAIDLADAATRRLVELLTGSPLPDDQASLDRWADDGGPVQ